ncbi:hypothetical protein N7488_008648 [Penicillium malachiteum]|nr:hypothetical protein N7488_008648 [Penicillium malachiteum]
MASRRLTILLESEANNEDPSKGSETYMKAFVLVGYTSVLTMVVVVVDGVAEHPSTGPQQLPSPYSTQTQQLGQWLENVKNGAVAAADFNNEPAQFQSTAKNFESIFGFVYFGPQNTAENDAALVRVKLIYGKAFQDARTTTKNPTFRDFTGSGGIRRDVSSYYGWVDPETQNDATSTQRTSVLALCQGYISQWSNNYLNGNTLTSLWGATFNTGSMSLDAFQGSIYTSGSIHELSHAAEAFGARYLLDKDCTVAGITGSAYGWNCMADFTQKSPDDAIKNAAIAFELNDWSTGISSPV